MTAVTGRCETTMTERARARVGRLVHGRGERSDAVGFVGRGGGVEAGAEARGQRRRRDVRGVEQPERREPGPTWHHHVLCSARRQRRRRLPVGRGVLCVCGVEGHGGEAAELCAEALEARGFEGVVDALGAFFGAVGALDF